MMKLLEKKIMQCEMAINAAVNQQLVQGTVSSATFVRHLVSRKRDDLAPESDVLVEKRRALQRGL